jgi:cobalt/nickel transport system permease protein
MAAVMVGVMLVVQSIPLGVPYHMNLSGLAGIVLGPWWALLSILVTNIAQATFGHGGITIVGLNTLVVWSEALIGYYLFAVLRKALRGPLAAGASTFVALTVSAFLVVGIVASSGIDPTQALGEHFREFLPAAESLQVSLMVFMILTLPIALGGALLEALVTSLLVAYVLRVKPSLIPRGD